MTEYASSNMTSHGFSTRGALYRVWAENTLSARAMAHAAADEGHAVVYDGLANSFFTCSPADAKDLLSEATLSRFADLSDPIMKLYRGPIERSEDGLGS